MEGFIQTFESLNKTRKLNPFSILLLGQDSSYLTVFEKQYHSSPSIKPKLQASLSLKSVAQFPGAPWRSWSVDRVVTLASTPAFRFLSPHCYSLDRMYSLQVTHLPQAWFSPGMGMWLEEVG